MLNYRNTNIVFLTLFALLLLFSFFVTVHWWFFLILFAIRFVILVVGSSFIQLGFHLQAYCNNPLEKEKNIALTFDDGPHEMTLLVLDVLKKHNAKATFFCIGKNAEKHPEIIKQIISEGHIVGNHSYNHSRLFDFYRKDKLVEEIVQTDALIKKISGKKTILFRPPFGVTNPSIKKALQVTKHHVIGWNVRSLDGVIKNEKLVFNRIKKLISPGGIVLLHDTSLQSVNALEQLLQFVEENKYKVISLEQLLEIKAYED
ncbi:polysaccharide deacetylase family protein [Flavobacterium psychrophilum]|nr:polysaccharide deacetylase family protein [Flavobacterium psychrophilum]ELY2009981.1 polysaccharide deacetylase family protein [Flavobacterium psychrophilum]